jgi:hypothetical protein
MDITWPELFLISVTGICLGSCISLSFSVNLLFQRIDDLIKSLCDHDQQIADLQKTSRKKDIPHSTNP